MARKQEPAAPRRKKRRSVAGLVAQDLLMTLAFLCVFALFHHVLPRWQPKTAEIVAPVSIRTPETVPPETVPPETAAPETAAPEETAEPSPEPTSEPETPPSWRERFSEYFSDEIVETDDGYTSPSVSVQIRYYEEKIGGIPQRYYVADIHIAEIDCLRTAPAYNGFTVYGAESVLSLAAKNGAILAVNGDYCNVQRYGLLVRNGDLYFSDPAACDICVLFEDGTMETWEEGSYDVDEILARKPYQIWRFGPALLDAEGKARSSFDDAPVFANRHPRTGLGYYEPGHYCLVVFEGRFNDAGGLSVADFAAFFEQLGCRCAYNMDGGASSVMAFRNRVCNRQSSERYLGDIIFVCEPDTPWPEIVS